MQESYLKKVQLNNTDLRHYSSVALFLASGNWTIIWDLHIPANPTKRNSAKPVL